MDRGKDFIAYVVMSLQRFYRSLQIVYSITAFAFLRSTVPVTPGSYSLCFVFVHRWRARTGELFVLTDASDHLFGHDASSWSAIKVWDIYKEAGIASQVLYYSPQIAWGDSMCASGVNTDTDRGLFGMTTSFICLIIDMEKQIW